MGGLVVVAVSASWNYPPGVCADDIERAFPEPVPERGESAYDEGYADAMAEARSAALAARGGIEAEMVSALDELRWEGEWEGHPASEREDGTDRYPEGFAAACRRAALAVGGMLRDIDELKEES